MRIYMAFTLFSLTILVYWIMSELFTMLFRFTGLPDERARFQVVSLLTGCGFTTKESELFLSSPARRRLARVTMLFGYVFNLTIVTAFINLFLSYQPDQLGQTVLGFLIPLGVAALIIISMRVRVIRAWVDRMLEKLAGRVLHQELCNTVLPIDYIGQESIALVNLKTVPEALRGVPLSRTGLKADENILVMLIEKPGMKPEPATAETLFEDGDKLTVFGDYRTTCRVFEAKENLADE